MIVPDRIYRIIRQIRLTDGRIITVSRRVKVLAVDNDAVIVDNGDGTQRQVSIEEFRRDAEEV